LRRAPKADCSLNSDSHLPILVHDQGTLPGSVDASTTCTVPLILRRRSAFSSGSVFSDPSSSHKEELRSVCSDRQENRKPSSEGGSVFSDLQDDSGDVHSVSSDLQRSPRPSFDKRSICSDRQENGKRSSDARSVHSDMQGDTKSLANVRSIYSDSQGNGNHTSSHALLVSSNVQVCTENNFDVLSLSSDRHLTNGNQGAFVVLSILALTISFSLRQFFFWSN
jgi:hypothetical protein